MTYGEVRASLARGGKPIGPLDTLIGSHARSLDVILVTHNAREFARIEDLRLEDWTKTSRAATVSASGAGLRIYSLHPRSEQERLRLPPPDVAACLRYRG